MTKYLVVDGRGGWLNARAIDLTEQGIVEETTTQLRWIINPKIVGMPKGPFRISRFEQVPITLTGAALTKKKIELANQGDDSWVDVELVGLPVDETWVDAAGHDLYSRKAQGPFAPSGTPQLSPMDAAKARLQKGAPMRGWESLATVASPNPDGEAKTRWRAPDPDGYLDQLANGDLMLSVRQMLQTVNDPLKQDTFEFVHTPVALGSNPVIRSPLRGIPANLGGGSTQTASWHPLGALLLAAASDPFAALALGFGCGLVPFESGAKNAAYRISLPIGTDANGETVEIADIVWALPVPPPPRAVTGLSVRHMSVIQPFETDDARMDSVAVAWDRPLSPQDTPLSDAPYPTSYAIARLRFSDNDAQILLSPRAQVEGWQPFVATRAGDGGPITFSDNLLGISFIDQVEPAGQVAKYAVAAQDMFGRWSPWAAVEYRGEPEPAQIPGIQSLTINSAGEAEVIFSWDWTTRSPEFVELVGEFQNAGGTTPGFVARINFAGNNQPALDGLRVVPLDQALKDTTWGVQQEQPSSDSGFRVRYYRLTASIGPDTGVPQRTFQVKARGQCRLHHMFSTDFGISGFTEPRTVVVYSTRVPTPPAFDGQPTEAPLWASVRDASGLSRFVVHWNTIPGAVGYVLYEATETTVLAALGGGAVDTAGSYVTRLADLRHRLHQANLLDIRQLFRRVNKELIPGTSQEVTLPRGSSVIHLYAVTAVTANRIESAWTASGDNVLAVAVPHIRVPSPPILQATAAVSDGGAPGVRLLVALGADTKLGRVDIYRTTKPELAANVDKMGPPLPNFSVTGEMPELKDIGVDASIKPGWGKIYYRAVCWSLRDDKKGLVEARSLAAPAVSVIVPPNAAPQILDLQVNESGSTATEALVSWTSDAPLALTPYGYFDVVVEGRDGQVQVFPPRQARLDKMQLLAPGSSLPAGTPGEAQIFLVGTANNYRLHARLPRPSALATFQLTVKMIDPLGRIGTANRDVPQLGLETPQLSPITFEWVAPPAGVFQGTFNAQWTILSALFQPALNHYSFSVELDSATTDPSTGSTTIELPRFLSATLAQILGDPAQSIHQVQGTQQFFTGINLDVFEIDVTLTDPLGRTAVQFIEPKIVTVPKLDGVDLDNAVSQLTGLELRVEVAEALLIVGSPPIVDSMVPPPDTRVFKGTRILVTPKNKIVPVPDVLGKGLDEAKQKIQEVGLVPDEALVALAHAETAVVGSLDPAENTPVAIGKHVLITLVDTEPPGLPSRVASPDDLLPPPDVEPPQEFRPLPDVKSDE